jgi:hypothetical protein
MSEMGALPITTDLIFLIPALIAAEPWHWVDALQNL